MVHVFLSVYLAIIEWGWVGYEEFCRSRRVLCLNGVSPFRSLFFCSPKSQFRPQVFSVNGWIICSGLHFWRHFDVNGWIICSGLHFWCHWLNMTKILSKFGEQQLVMVNYACGFNQSETGKYFEWIIISNYWMRLSRIWRILQIKEGIIHRGWRPSWITPSEICRILHTLQKQNSIITLLFIQNISLFLKEFHHFALCFFLLTKYNTTLSPGFPGQRFNNLQRAALLT